MTFPSFLSVPLTGLMMSLGLIVVIGAQNAFVLRQGLRGEHVLAVCLACALSDAVLITLGVRGLGRVLGWWPWIDPVLRFGGAGFLALYGARALRAAWRPGATLEAAKDAGRRGLGATLLTCLALTWLNPHVYLDTVLLLGSVATRFPGQGAGFALGAICGSFLFFFSLGYGARGLRPLFARPRAWQVLDLCIGAIMWAIALRLAAGF
ncbi:LysE/ArgO family amino acid transporter [Pseudooceanicola sp. CBS1P-1]|uniref:LysE family transporter n=1 Tax=Pseudooceanicola albus TaxID=2692189 RepID=A0A6L7GBP9_9RHOB|nr:MULTISPECIES: LysE/ArgO family amino acid transporter [Pseudooceanicola]MBT9387001.1 LysE/ArgO family amino acid transporter [Pseudooceanicola endophyticus]MXN21132.1 LysE family transporter [Pseudooceanicola albus]